MSPDAADLNHLTPFEDVIDGYFPLQISLAQMMSRLGADVAWVQITHAPIMVILGLPNHAPVPLNIHSGRAGIIDWMNLRVEIAAGQTILAGSAAWRWLDGSSPEPEFDPMTRLAEPAYLKGYFICEGETRTHTTTRVFEGMAAADVDLQRLMGQPKDEGPPKISWAGLL